MSNKIKAAASVLVILAAAISCVENDRTMGQQLASDDFILKIDSTQFTIPFCQRVHDTIQAVSYSRMLVGYLSDEQYGTVVVDGASVVVPVPDEFNMGVNPELVDVYLSLSIDSTVAYTSGNKSIPQNIYLYEIVKDFAADSTRYYNNSITPDFLSEDPISLGSPMVFGSGTVKIGLTREYGEKLLATSPSEFADISIFLNRMFGIYIKTDKPDREVPGGRLNYINLSTSTITLEFLMNDPQRGIKDKDTTVTFVFGYTMALNQFSAGSRHLETATPRDTLFVDGLSGVKPVIPAHKLKGIVDDWVDRVCLKENCTKESIFLSQAKLILPYDMPPDAERFENEHPSKLYPFTTNVGAADTTVRMRPVDGIASSDGGSMDRNHEYYYCTITSYVQNMITKDRSSVSSTDDLWICPVTTFTNTSTYATSYLLDVDNYHRVILNGPYSDRPPRIELVYGILKEW